MNYNASDYVFKAPPVISRARRVLIKPAVSYAAPYPVTTSPGIISQIIQGIRQVSDADILILGGTPTGAPIQPVYQKLGYDFPRVLMLDIKDSIWVEVDNPLTKPLIVPTFWIPNVILSSDYLISVSPMQVIQGRPYLSMMNLVTVLPGAKYGSGSRGGWEDLFALGMDKVMADLYFTLPFDLAIIEGRQEFISQGDPARGDVKDFGRMFVGEPYQVDLEASQALGIKAEYLASIDEARKDLEGSGSII